LKPVHSLINHLSKARENSIITLATVFPKSSLRSTLGRHDKFVSLL
jgi:hypothetical protein